MISKVKLERFRCFLDTTFTLKELSVLVGENNAGKSTIVEALRLISLITAKYKNSHYADAPSELNLEDDVKGIKPSIRSLPFTLGENAIYYNWNPPAIITVFFSTREKFVIYVMVDNIFALIYDNEKKLVTSNQHAKSLNIPEIRILPQIRPLLKEEKILNRENVKESMDSYLAYRHFRNELLIFKEMLFSLFKQTAEDSWKYLKIHDVFIGENEDGEPIIKLNIEDNRYPTEVCNIGCGLQMWLQVIWFLCNSNNNACIILDEPDVYMHPDLQIKLLSMVKGKYRQVIIATHSVEIMASVEPKNILLVNKDKQYLPYAPDVSAVQRIVEHIGGIYNLQLIRLGQAKKCIFVEGEDMDYLKLLYKKLYPNSISLDTIPNMDIKGFSNYKDAIGGANAFKNIANEAISTYCILDRDYYLDEKIEAMKTEALESGLNLFIWSMKELENYLINPSVLFRLIHNRQRDADWAVFISEFTNMINAQFDFLHREYATAIQNEDRGIVAGTAMKRAYDYLKARWITLNDKIALLPGRKFLGQLKVWIKDKYNLQISEYGIIKEIQCSEIHSDIKFVLSTINEAKPFDMQYLYEEA